MKKKKKTIFFNHQELDEQVKNNVNKIKQDIVVLIDKLKVPSSNIKKKN